MNPCLPTTDLRAAFLRMLVHGIYAPDEPSPSPAGDTDDAAEGAAEDGGGTDEDDELDDELDRDHDAVNAKPSRVKELSDEAAKWRRKFREASDRVTALEESRASEALQVENQDLRLRIPFNDECHHHDVSDRDAIWKLAGDDIKVAVKDDGTVDVERLRNVVGSLVERYPHFVRDDGPDPEPAGSGLPPSGKRTDGKVRPTDPGSNRSVLERKFPALRGH